MKKNLRLGAAVAAIVLGVALAGCAKKAATADASANAQSVLKPAYGTFGVDTSWEDKSVKPGDDFARFANGKWLDTFQIPADLAGYATFTKLSLDGEAQIKGIVEDLAAKAAPKGAIEQKVGDFYKSWMNEDAVNAAGAAPLKPFLDKISAISSKDDVAHALASVHFAGPATFAIYSDPADPTRPAVFVDQSGIGLPDRDYYLKSDEKFQAYQAAYRAYIAKVLALAGMADTEAKAKAIYDFEAKLAKVQWSQEDSRDVKKTNNPMSAKAIAALAPDVNWAIILGDRGVSAATNFIVEQPSAITAEAKIFAAADKELLKDYFAFHLINTYADYLAKDFSDAKFEMFSKTLRGVETQRDRWKRGVNEINGALGDAVGEIYVAKYFPPSSKATMDELVGNLRAALKERLEKNQWMDEETRRQALAKLATFEPRIGYPAKYTDYSTLEISPTSLFDNAVALTEFSWRDQTDRLGKPIDRARWDYPPQTVNASYDPLLNQITFPAGILQPPFFDPAADPAVNYGAIGAVIGHEIGHGFDDQGRLYDEKGRVRNWWSDASNKAFEARATRLGAQYDRYEPVPGAHVSGQLTMGENIGDLGGMQMAYSAYHRFLDQHSGGKDKVIDGLTGDQRFFLAWAQVWQSKDREDLARQRVETDPHSPPYFRINGVVRNIDAWYDAFDVKPGDALYLAPEDRVRIW